MAELRWHLEEVAEIVQGTISGEGNPPVRGIVTDSRHEIGGALYLALVGDNFDGHDFVGDSARKGAVAALVSKPTPELAIPQVIVENTLEALQTLGLVRRREFDGPFFAITGSSGKTTTRRLLAAILGERWVTHQPVRNFNNHVGVPLTLLELEARHEATVLELGCSDFGEIATLTKCSDPDIALVTNVGPAHLERLGDLDGVARAKGELFAGLREDATTVVNLDDPRVAAMPRRTERCLYYGTSEDADARLLSRRPAGASGQEITLRLRDREIDAVLPLIGSHNAANAVAAAAAALAVGLGEKEVVGGLAEVKPESGRLALRQGAGGMLVIDDTYNANPESMRAALDALVEIAGDGKRIAVLGNMLELGKRSDDAHKALGRLVAEKNIDVLVSIGEGGTLIDRGAEEAGLPANSRFLASDHARAAEYVKGRARREDAVLVKGSRGMRMEQIVDQLLEGRK